MSKLLLDDVLNSKIYIKDNVGIQFQSPASYIEPFLLSLNKLSPSYEIEVSGRVANKNSTDTSINEAFARVKVEAKLPAEYNIHEHDTVVGLVYALDIGKPVMKVYTGQNAWACTNLCIFRADQIHQIELMQGVSTIYDKTKTFSERITEQVRDFSERLTQMKERQYAGDEIDEVIGKLLRKSIESKGSVGTTPIVSAAQSLFDKSSVYGIKDNKTSEWNIYSALTQYLTDKADLLDRATKTLYVSNMFDQLHLNNN
jgi:hypothetical protein